jgi:hypothetical protein
MIISVFNCVYGNTRRASTASCTDPYTDVKTALGLAAQLVEILDIRTRRAVNPLHFGIGRLNHVVFIRRMRPASVTQTEMACGQPQRIAGEDIAGP